MLAFQVAWAIEYATCPIHAFSGASCRYWCRHWCAQEHLLAQLARVLRVAHHAPDDVPAQAPGSRARANERARFAAQHGGHQGAILGVRPSSWAMGWAARIRLQRFCDESRNQGHRTPYPRPERRIPRPGRAPHMNFEIPILITLFLAIAYTIQAVVDAGVRRKMVDSNGSQDLVVDAEGEGSAPPPRFAALGRDPGRGGDRLRHRAGRRLDKAQPGVIAVLVSATGIQQPRLLPAGARRLG